MLLSEEIQAEILNLCQYHITTASTILFPFHCKQYMNMKYWCPPYLVMRHSGFYNHSFFRSAILVIKRQNIINN